MENPPRPLPPAVAQEFKELYRQHYGEELSDADAADGARRLVRLYELVYGPDLDSCKPTEN